MIDVHVASLRSKIDKPFGTNTIATCAGPAPAWSRPMTVRARLGRLPLRARLVAGFSATMFVVLHGRPDFVYWRVDYALDRQINTELKDVAGVVTPLVLWPGWPAGPRWSATSSSR